jgi:hypothetical protein
MQFVLFIYQPEHFDPKALTQQEHGEIAAQYRAVSGTAGVTAGPPLGLVAKATTVRVVHDETQTTGGPYVSAAGAVGGYMVVDAESIDDAVALAARVPAARLGGAVEVRQCEVYW